jgi:putative transposase
MIRERATPMAGRTERQAILTLAQFAGLFRAWVLETYHHRHQRRIEGAPLERWQQGTWLPRLPESLAQLDLLLLREGTLRQVHQEGIFFMAIGIWRRKWRDVCVRRW